MAKNNLFERAYIQADLLFDGSVEQRPKIFLALALHYDAFIGLSGSLS